MAEAASQNLAASDEPTRPSKAGTGPRRHPKRSVATGSLPPLRPAPSRPLIPVQRGGRRVQQKVIGLIGGMSWESSAEYYRIINESVRDRLGGLRSARCLLWSFDFAEIEALQHAGRWEDATALMIEAARRLERGGADFILICTNTMHRMAEAVQAAIAVPLLHIADPTAERIRAAGHRRIGLLGTAFTMEQDFYKGRLATRHGLDVLIPGEADRATVHRIIYEELVQGRAEPASREAYRGVIARLVERGAEAVILGCTEIMLLVRPEDSAVPLYDTTAIHAEAAVQRAITA
ncbi:aspartate/glutamate racemase family protein [Roseomonas sp. SG15]|uniref:Aspartate/glutamate racemase family protein n=1 Tax=Roseomonas indoligenes TaxID=2820811 RepID=A0A940MZD8_9PROT|nr:aspartate/glutamate racemase family protein [Pararoseomonas indoligenes]MBP0493860.1 aspartate/glutamate racemase family protein [Pararoseomonas indoligenes]